MIVNSAPRSASNCSPSRGNPFTLPWNPCSRSRGNTVHHRVEYAMAIGGYRRLYLEVRENSKLRVSLPSGSSPLANVSPEVEKRARVALAATAEVTELA